jgi:hypothetical protein
MKMIKSILISTILITVCFAGNGGESRFDGMGPKSEIINPDNYQSIIYVSVKSGSDTVGEGTREKPWQSIQKALSLITENNESNHFALFVAEGIYGSGTLRMKEYTDLFGGFSGADWNRDIFQNQTVLNGNGKNRVVIAANNSRLDGFVIINGRVKGHGAGILCDDTSPEISNNVITDNITCEPDDFNYTRIHQEGNQGGGIACFYNAVPVIRNNIFYKNKTGIGMGAGVAVYGWVRVKGGPETEFVNNRMVSGLRAKIENNVFIDNLSGIHDTGRTRSSNGAAIGCAYEARPIIKNNLILNNIAQGRSDAGGIYVEYFSFPDIIENYILGNGSDDDGGGIYVMRSSHPLIKDNYIAGNYTEGGGPGGVRLSKEGRATISGNTIVQNSGGGVLSVDAYMELFDNIIMDNPGGYGVSIRSVFSYFPAAEIRNNKFSNNEKGAIEIADNISIPPVIKENMMSKMSEEWADNNSDFEYDYQRNRIDGKINEYINDEIRYISTIRLLPDNRLNEVKVGDVIKIAKRWSVIKGINNNEIEIWGQLTPEDITLKEYTILPIY